MNDFRGSQLKIKRANEHIDDLERRMKSFAVGDAYALRIDADAESGSHLLQATIAKAVPDDFALILGDALHNLRCALDFAICDIEFAHTRKWTEKTSFPVRGTRDELVAAINGGLIKKIPAPIAAFIVDTLQPYSGGDGDRIWSLHKLEILDKHRLLLPYMQLGAIFNIRLEDAKGAQIPVPSPWIITRTRTAYQQLFGENLKIADKGHLGVAIFFEQSLPLGGESILPALRELSELVRGVVALLRREFLMIKQP